VKKNRFGRSFLIMAALLIAVSVGQAGTVTGSNFASVGYDLTQSGVLYVVEEGIPWANWALMTFDFSTVPADTIGGDGTLSLTVDTTWYGAPLTAVIEVDALESPYDPSDLGAVALPVSGTELDSETVTGVVPGNTITFDIPEATLVSWANSPGTNYGIVIRETQFIYSPYNTTDISFDTDQAPQISFATATPEPSTMALTGLAALALGASGLRRWRASRKRAI